MKNRLLLLLLCCVISNCVSSVIVYAQGPCPVLTTLGSATSATICYTGRVAINTSGGYTTATETWSSSDNSIATVISTGAGTATVYGVAVGAATITYDDGGSPAAICYFPVTVETTVSPTVMASSASICLLATERLSANPAGGTWSSSDAAVISVDASGNVYGIAAGTAAITYIYTNSCGSFPATYAMTADPNPGTISGPTAVCAGAYITLSDVGGDGGGAWISSNTAVATVDVSSGTVGGVSAGTVTISYLLPTHCGTALATYSVTVDAPASPSVGGAESVCAGSVTAPLTGTPSGGTWLSGSAAVATVDGSGDVGGVTAGRVTITYTYTNSCGSYPATYPMTINPLPDIAVVMGGVAVCEGYSITLSDATTGGTWSSSDVTLATVDASTGTVYGVSAPGVLITYTVTNGYGCTSFATHNVAVQAPISVDAITGTAAVCVEGTTTLADATTGGAWSSATTGIATVDGTGDVTGAAAGTATISYSVTNSCGTYAATEIVTVNPIAGTLTGITALEVCYTSGVVLSTSGTTGGTWSSSATTVATVIAAGDPGVALVYGVAAGTATITYTIASSGGCATTATIVVTMDPEANAGTITGTAWVCTGASTTLSDAVTGGTWSSADDFIATVDASGNVYGGYPLTVTISYTVSNACGPVSATQVVTVNPTTDPGTITGSATLCAGAIITLSDAVTGGTWSSSNTTIATVDGTGDVTGVAGGTATISYTVMGACVSATATYVVTINTDPSAGPLSGDVDVYVGYTISLSSGGDPGGTWSSSDATIATVDASSGTVGGVASGMITISYSVTNSCATVIATYTVTVYDVPAITGTNNVCAPGSVETGLYTTLTASVPGGYWSSSNTTVATVYASGPNTAFVYSATAGTATISYTCTVSSVALTATEDVTVNPTPMIGTVSGPTYLPVGGAAGTYSYGSSLSGGTWVLMSAAFAFYMSISSDEPVQIEAVTGSGTFAIYYIVEDSNGCQSMTPEYWISVY